MKEKIHFIGCLGVSMKTLMELAQKEGDIVTGSDTDLFGHDAKNVEKADLVVYSASIKPDNVEMVRAKELKIPTITRGEMLARLCSSYDFSIAVSGTHGKTTTTAMLWQSSLPLNPTVHIGGRYDKKDAKFGEKNLFITEACEYKRSFLSISPDIAIILNTDLDHTDCYKDSSEMRESFLEFAKKAKRAVIVNGAEINKDEIETDSKVISVGLKKECDYFAYNIRKRKFGRFSFSVKKEGKKLGRVILNISGRHNVLNALFTISALIEYGMDFSLIKEGLFEFKGVERRMEFLGEKGRCEVFSDYAHHPREIEASISSAKESKHGQITAVFEPHTYTRTKSFYNEFAKALSKADNVILLPIYPAREQSIIGITSQLISDNTPNSFLCNSYNEAKQILDTYCNKKGVILFMGAGSIDSLARDFVKK